MHINLHPIEIGSVVLSDEEASTSFRKKDRPVHSRAEALELADDVLLQVVLLEMDIGDDPAVEVIAQAAKGKGQGQGKRGLIFAEKLPQTAKKSVHNISFES